MVTYSDALRIAGVTAVLSLSWVAVESPGPGARLERVIERFAAGAVPVNWQDLDARACGRLPDRPGIVMTALNDDGWEDYGVLLRLKDTGAPAPLQGGTVRPAQFALVMFLPQGDEFTTHVARRFSGDAPLPVVIQSQPPGVVRHRDTGSEVRLRHNGIMMSFCKKSATVYYLEGDRVRAIPVVD